MPNDASYYLDRVERLRADPDLRPHGRLSTYNNWGCRCDDCRAARAAYERTRTAKDFQSVADPDAAHATFKAYNAGCRCDACLAFVTFQFKRTADLGDVI